MDAIVDPDGEGTAELRDWKPWFAAYDDPDSPLFQRLAVVRQGIRTALDEAPAGSVNILSLCAGQGRDLIPVLAEHPRRADVRARLIEFGPEIAQVARDGTAIWTRHRKDPAVVPRIQVWFTEAGLSIVWESDPELPTTIYVAANRQERDPVPTTGDAKLFRFTR